MSTAVNTPAHSDRGLPVTPEPILQMGFAFWGSRALVSAIEVGVFAELAGSTGLGGEELRDRLGLHPRGARDLFDALVALGLLEREDGCYSCSAAAGAFLDPSAPGYVGDFLVMAANRPTWPRLTEALLNGEPQSVSSDGEDFFDDVYADPEKLAGFLRAMTSNSAGTARALASAFPWERYRTVLDVGCAEGGVLAQLASGHGHLKGVGLDLSVVRPHFDRFVAGTGLSDRLRFQAGDFLTGDLPGADVIIMGHILHDWDLATKRLLLQKAHAALPDGGTLIVYETLIDDDRRETAFALLMSLNMLVETRGGFDFTGAECRNWMRDAGFRESRVEHLAGPVSMVVGVR